VSNRSIVILKVLAHIACLAPALWLAVHLVLPDVNFFGVGLGPDPTATVTFFTGHATLRLLIISLAVTPVRRLSSRLSWLIRFRRMVGLYAFFYGCLHLLTYIGLYAGFNVHTMLDDIAKRRYIMAGMLAWSLLVPLALTSTNWSIRKLGGKRWQWLHRVVYLSAISAVVHYWWKVKPGDHAPMMSTIVLAILLIVRPVWSLATSRRKPAAQPASAA
jgi:methionine sulfoxide reductase heme-binding subunit